MADVSWVVVIAAKGLGTAKSRLAEVAGAYREQLALAMLADTVAAARHADGVREVLVVTADAAIGEAMRAVEVSTVADSPALGLNSAFGYGIAAAIARHADCGVALLAGDLPALLPGDLSAALAAAALSSTPVVVADRAATGTTMLASRTPISLRPSFGAGSLARHRSLGARVVEHLEPAGEIASLRCDVDDAADLEIAVRLGVGSATAAVIATAGITT
jgi:2-phospho-L-lactate/phosphoenolpyruvate guanylyltransferase